VDEAAPVSVIAIIAILLVLLLPALILYWAASLLLLMIRIRQRSWIAVTPRLERTGTENLSVGMRMFLEQLARPVRDAGFEPTESVHAPGFSGFGGWTQVLYVNRETGERASFLDMPTPNGPRCTNLVLASELPARDPITTGFEAGPLTIDANLTSQWPELLARHRAAVLAFVAAVAENGGSEGLPKGIVPAPEEALTWLQERAARVAEADAMSLGYRKNRQGDRYYATWLMCFEAAIREPLIRRRHRPPRGFDVVSSHG
jgi:hypothetical protein